MHRPSIFCAAIAATGLLAAPAAALASTSVVAGPFKVKGYAMSITATDNGANDTLGIFALKTSGTSQQLHSWSLNRAKVSVKGSKATIKGDFGSFGKINAKVNAGGKVKGVVPAGCKGTAGSARKGKLTGSTKLVLDSTFFRTVKPKAINAQILKAAKFECEAPGGPGNASGLMLMSNLTTPSGQLMVNVMKTGSGVTQQVSHMDQDTSVATVLHMISAEAGESGLTAAADLSTASSRAVGPFLSGALNFSGEGMGTMATGTVSGGFTAKFDSIGSQSLPEGHDAMLMQR